MPHSKVPFIDLTRHENTFLENLLPLVKENLVRGQFVGSQLIEELERDLAAFEVADHVVACANGTDALQLSLRALGVGAGDTVLIQEMTFWATAEAVFNVGARPATVDVGEDFHPTAQIIELALKKFKPKAVILTHLFGWAARETLAIRELCEKHQVFLLEDSAQAFHTKLQDDYVLGSAKIATTSFYPTKVLGACGDAGAVFTKDKKLAAKIKTFTNHGRTGYYLHGEIGWNSRMGVYEATFLRESLKFLEARLETRRHACDFYRKHLSSTQLKFPLIPESIEANGYISVALVENSQRDALFDHLAKHEIHCAKTYPIPISLQPAIKETVLRYSHPEMAEELGKKVINLPCFNYISQNELESVEKAVKAFF